MGGMMDAGMGGAIIGGITQALDSGLTAAFQNRQAKKARKHAVMMYRNRYQWAVEDMKAAGLNPILAATGGIAGTGATPAPASIGRGNPAAAAAALSRAFKENALLDSERRAKEAQAASARSSERLQDNQSRTNWMLRPWAVASAAAESRAKMAEADLRELAIPAARADAEYYATPEGKRLRQVQRVMEVLPAWAGGAAAGALFGGLGSAAAQRRRAAEMDAFMREYRRPRGIGRRRRR